MYIRDAQGQLRYIPPQGVAPVEPQMAHRQAIQNHLRNQIQQEEWNRFNAPPPEDNLYHQDQQQRFTEPPSPYFRDQQQHFAEPPSSYFQDQQQHFTEPPSPFSNSMAPGGNAPMFANHGNMIYPGQQTYNQADPPIPRVIHSTPDQRYSHTTHNNISSPLGSPVGFSNTRSMQYSNAKTANEEFDNDVDIGCMNILFGSASKPNHNNEMSPDRNTVSIRCNRLNISTNCVRPEGTNAFQCNGIRGPGKKFNYSYDKESDYIKTHEEYLPVVSQNQGINTPRVTTTMTTTMTPKNATSRDTFQFNAPERQAVYVESSKALQIHNAPPVVLSSAHANKKGAYPLEDVLINHDSYGELSCIVDTISMMTEKQPPQGIGIIVTESVTTKSEGNDMTNMQYHSGEQRNKLKTTANMQYHSDEQRNKLKTSDAISTGDVEEILFKPRYNQNIDTIEKRDRTNNHRINETEFTTREQAEIVENIRNICLEKSSSIPKDINDEDYPSFDEPEPEPEPDTNITEIHEIDAQQPKENRQIDANHPPQLASFTKSTGKAKEAKEQSTKIHHVKHNMTIINSKNGTTTRTSKRVHAKKAPSQNYLVIEEVASC